MGSFTGSSNDIGAILGQTSNRLQNYIDQSVNTFMSSASHLGSHITDRIMTQYNVYVESNIGHRAAAIRNSVTSAWQLDTVRALVTPNQLQQANPNMIRWVMSHPDLRSLDTDKRIDGYKDYVNPNPNVEGRDHYDYRRVYNGMVTKTDNGLGYSNYHEHMLDEDYVLSSIDKTCIMSTHDAITESIEEGIDPTSEWNNTIR